MGKRRDARILAVQFLYQTDHAPPDDLDEVRQRFLELMQPSPGVRDLALPLITGVLEKRDELDSFISRFSENWDLDRIAAVDRCILRLALYELKFKPDVPPAVAINEAIELAKRMSTEHSGRFVNGILDHARKTMANPQEKTPESN